MKNTCLEPKIFTGKDEEDPERWIKRYDCFRITCNWTEDQAMEYIDLFLEGKALMWHKGICSSITDWASLKDKFIKTFKDEEIETAAWNELVSYACREKDTIEITGDLSRLFEKAKITSSTEKLRFLLRSLSPKQKRKVLSVECRTFEAAMDILVKNERLDKVIKDIPMSDTQTKNIVKDIDPMDSFITRFEALSVNLINKVEQSQVAMENQKRYYDSNCSICNRFGHKSDSCYQRRNNFKESTNKMTGGLAPNDNKFKGINCIEVLKPEISEKDIFVAEKRAQSEEISEKSKRTRIFDTANNDQIIKERPRIQEIKPVEIKLSEAIAPYSIRDNLSEANANLSISQLLQVSPSVRRELMSLCKRVETKEVDKIELDEISNTNCRGLVSIFGKRHWAILDTGAACSVISETMMQEIGLEVDANDNQIIITADGTRHNTLGTISSVPIKIANYSFPADVLVIKVNKPMLILGTDWFTRYRAVLDLKSKELVLEAPNADVVLKLYTKTPHKRIYEEIEIFGIAIEKDHNDICHFETKDINTLIISDVLDKFHDLFVSDMSELTQTTAVEHSIETGNAQPIKLYPYRVPHVMKDRVREELEKKKDL
ncbi:DNA damage-inducible protein 1 [Smittium culicis]|uniref:DNA damage-inducible protein 1 n=1 Tax=Smittium culicis TaxID=133412 RepID=A0A1R1XDH3_9FUNG|nr:DNA damage-inducible protein 1 [Smittium culicis]